MSYYNPITTIASVGTQSTPIPVTIASATEPTTRENGGTLRQGDNWYNTTSGEVYIWITDTEGGSWKIIGSGGSVTLATFKNIVASSTDFDDFKTKVAAL